jgi:hypothetical protein
VLIGPQGIAIPFFLLLAQHDEVASELGAGLFSMAAFFGIAVFVGVTLAGELIRVVGRAAGYLVRLPAASSGTGQRDDQAFTRDHLSAPTPSGDTQAQAAGPSARGAPRKPASVEGAIRGRMAP